MALRAALLGLAFGAGLPPALAQSAGALPAGGEVKRFEIPAGPLDAALERFARTAGVNLSYDAASLAGRSTPGLRGSHPIAGALSLLLAGSGIEAQPLPGGGYALRKAAAAAAPAAASAPAPARAQAAEDVMLPAVKVAAKAEPSTTTEGSGRYAAQATAAATGLVLSPRETPQSLTVITRQRIEDQGATELAEVFRLTPGLSFEQSGSQGSDGNALYVRGFAVENYQVDGIPQLNSWLLQTADLAIYDRVEVLRGATGLLNGVGTPAATINLVRKRPTKDFQGGASLAAGSWNHYRAELDLSSPLNESGSVRGRVVAALQDNDLFIDRVQERKKILYGVLEADLTPATRLTAGLEYQQHDADGEARSGLPLFHADGSLTDFARSRSGGARWARSYQTHRALFTEFEHQFDNDWLVRAHLGQTRRKYDDVVGYVYGGWPTWPNADGSGFNLIANKWNAEYVQDALDLRANGPFELFGRRHELVAGFGISRTTYDAPGYDGWQILPIADFNTWDGRDPAEPAWQVTGMTNFEEKQSGVYATARLRPSDRLSVLVGGRASRWEQTTVDTPTGGAASTTSRRENAVTPYAGIVYDFAREASVYASYTDIFKPQNNKTASGSYLDPQTGKQYELGVKGALLDGRLEVSAALFRVQQDNLAVALPNQQAPDGSQAYVPVQGTRTTGYELEATGEVAPGWQLAAGYTHRRAKDGTGNPVNTEAPRDQFKLFTTRRLAGIGHGLTVGGGLTWQGSIYAEGAGPDGERFTQGAYAVVDLMARYPLTPALGVTAALNNVFDRKYYTTPWYSYYGTPRNLKLTLNYRF